jgi:hypothetical protein
MMMPLFCELFQAGNLCAAELVPGPCAAAQGNHAENALGGFNQSIKRRPGNGPGLGKEKRLGGQARN